MSFLYKVCSMREYILITAISFLIGFVADCIFGDPRNFPHSVNLIGNLIRRTEKFLRKTFGQSPKSERQAGVLLVITVCVTSFIVPAAILLVAFKVNTSLGIAVQSFMIWQILAAKSLMKESKKVYFPLIEDNIEEARFALSMIVGRDTAELDKEGIIKATVETVAENTSDGIIAPMFYVFFGGAPLGYLYKAINTMDSIVGYKNDKYLNFGRCAARLDDIANFLPARLSALFMIIASFALGFDGKNAAKIFKRDRFKHASPNSAQTESVCAGALRVRLAGDAKYFGKIYKKDYIGDNLREIEPQDILKSHRLMYGTTAALVLIFCVIWLVIFLI